MPNYQDAKIYRIICDDPKLVYIGSTTQPLSRRFGEHKSCFKKKSSNCSVNTILSQPGCKIVLIEKFPCNDKEELVKRETEIIEKGKYTVNQRKPFSDSKEKSWDSRQDVICGCGKSHPKHRRKQHERTKRHKRWMLNNP